MKDFQGLPFEEKRKVLSSRFPDFTLLPKLEQDKVINYREPTFGARALGTAIGMGRGLATTAEGMGEFATLGGLRFMPPEQRALLERMKTPRTPSEKAGKFAEQALEFVVPETLGARAVKGAPLLWRMGIEALKGAGISGLQTGFKPKEMAETGALGAAFPAAGKLTSLFGRYGSDLLGMWTGVGGEVIRTAATNATQRLKDAMRGGISEIQIAQDVRNAVQKVADARSAAYRQQLATLPQKTLNVVNPVKTDLLKSLRADYGIPAKRKMVPLPGGGWAPGPLELDFAHSAISNPADQQRILNLVTDLDSWQQHTTTGIDTLKRRVDSLYADSSDARAIIQKTKSQIRSALNREVPGYQKMTKDYAQATKFLDEFKREFSTKAGTGTLVRKVFPNALNQNNDYRKIMIEALSHAAGADIKGELAGGALRPVIPRGLVGRSILGGVLGGELFRTGHPEAAIMGALGEMLASSPRAVGEMMALISDLQRNPQVRALATAGGQAARGAGLEAAQQ